MLGRFYDGTSSYNFMLLNVCHFVHHFLLLTLHWPFPIVKSIKILELISWISHPWILIKKLTEVRTKDFITYICTLLSNYLNENHLKAVFPTPIDQKLPFWRQNWLKSPTLRAKFRPFFALISAKIKIFLTPSTLFNAFLCDNITKIPNLTIFFKFFLVKLYEKQLKKSMEKLSRVGPKKLLIFYVISEHFRRGIRKN